MGLRVARSSSFIAALAGLIIGTLLLLVGSEEVCPQLGIMCIPIPIWASADLFVVLLWSSVPVFGCLLTFALAARPGRLLGGNVLAFGLEATCLIAGGSLTVGHYQLGREIAFAHYYALYVLPFQLLSLLAAALTWLDIGLRVDSRPRR